MAARAKKTTTQRLAEALGVPEKVLLAKTRPPPQHLEQVRAAREPQRKLLDLEQLVGTRAEAIKRHKERLKREASEQHAPFSRGPGLPRKKLTGG